MNKRKVKIEINNQLKELQDLMIKTNNTYDNQLGQINGLLQAIDYFLIEKYPEELRLGIRKWNKQRNEEWQTERKLHEARELLVENGYDVEGKKE